MKLLALALIIISSSLAVNHAYAQGSLPQPQDAATREAAGILRQPLTRIECDSAGLTWNDEANVCGETAGSALRATLTPVPSSILINIDKASQRMTVSVDGTERYDWPVSTGQRGYSTPSGTYTANSMNEIWYSKQWDNAPMPHAIFFTKKGHAIHGTRTPVP